MRLEKYLEEHAGALILQVFLALLSGIYLWLTGTPLEAVICIDLIWLAAAAGCMGGDYYRKKKRFREISAAFRLLEEKYLFTEVIDRPRDQTERLYFEFSRQANKAMQYKIAEISRESREYKEYIESWIHEVKNPIAALDLYCRNNPSPENAEIRREAARIDELVTQALFYARSGSVEKDYFVREFAVEEAVLPALQDYRAAILEKGLRVETGELEEKVYTDPKWITFMVKQLLSNSVKYTGEGGLIRICAQRTQKGLWLCVSDNGCGISGADLGRACEKGFTGSDRARRQATGMGLYLVQKLCAKLGLSFTLRSKPGEGTTASVGFPAGDLTRP